MVVAVAGISLRLLFYIFLSVLHANTLWLRGSDQRKSGHDITLHIPWTLMCMQRHAHADKPHDTSSLMA